jgi:hypothetical protein
VENIPFVWRYAVVQSCRVIPAAKRCAFRESYRYVLVYVDLAYVLRHTGRMMSCKAFLSVYACVNSSRYTEISIKYLND